MKVAIIFPNNIFRAPYLNYYLQLLDENNIKYDIYNWDRTGVNEPNCISYSSKEESRKIWKIIPEFYKYKGFIKKNISNTNYDRVIVFSCQIAILLSSFLIKKFKDKYLIDIRDHSKVIHIFSYSFKKVLKKGKLICISSEGFRSWLPKNLPYTISHNISLERLKKDHTKRHFFQNTKLNIDTIGALRDFESNMKVIDVLKNRPEFYMKFIGDGYALPLLKKYIEAKNITNTYLHGYYKKEEEFNLLKNTDFINIITNDNTLSKSLTSNRLYLCALLKIPAIVNHNTEQSRIITKYNFGLVVNDYEKLPELLLNYRTNFDKEDFISNCNQFLNDVKKDQNIFKSKVLAFLQDN